MGMSRPRGNSNGTVRISLTTFYLDALKLLRHRNIKNAAMAEVRRYAKELSACYPLATYDPIVSILSLAVTTWPEWVRHELAYFFFKRFEAI